MTGPPPSPSPAKVCIRCGLDCAARPRTKDAQGRYTCRDCFDALQNEPAIILPPAPQRRTEHRIEPAPAPAPADGADGDADIYALMLDDAVQAQARVATAPCPGCGHPLAASAAICTCCGFNTRTGQAVTTKKAGAADPDIALDDDPLIRERRRERRRQNALATQMEFIKPLLLLVVGLGITCTLLNNRGGGDEVAGYLIVYTIALPATVAGFLFCCWMWLGFDAPLPLVAVRLAAVNAIVDVVLIGVGFAGMRMGIYVLGGRIILPLLCYAALLMYFMELDYEDALMAGLLTGIIKVVGTIFLIIALASAAGA